MIVKPGGSIEGPESLDNVQLESLIKAGVVKGHKTPKAQTNCKKSRCVALTFDDGPNNKSTDIILDALEQEDEVATFFVVGNAVSSNRGVIDRMVRDDHEIGNHSWDHKNFKNLLPAQIRQEISLTQRAVIDAGAGAPKILRPPYGSFNLAMLKHINMPIVLWNVDPRDWHHSDPKQIAGLVAAQARSGAIIVMHDKPATAKAAPAMIKKLKAKYKLVTVSQLLGLNKSSRGIYLGL